MNFFGNTSDPLAKTLSDLESHSENSGVGNSGDFFKPVHERDRHVKPKNYKKDAVEFNAVLLCLDDSSNMLKYIKLKNKIVSGDCLGLEENTTVDKEDGTTTVFMKWLQPVGSYELGSANPILDPVKVKELQDQAVKERAESAFNEETEIDDTTPVKKTKGKGTRKKNTNKKVSL